MAIEFAAGVQHKSKGRVRAVLSELCWSILCCFSVLRTPFGKDNLKCNRPLTVMAKAVCSECSRSRQCAATNQLPFQDDMKG